VRRLVKICGNAYPEDSYAVAALEPDFMGWIFAPSSPRRAHPETAGRLIAGIRRRAPGIRHVAVFAGLALPELMRILGRVASAGGAFDALQLVEPAQFVRRVGEILQLFPEQTGRDAQASSLWPVLRVAGPLSEHDLAVAGGFPLLLLDTHAAGLAGGTGQRFDPAFASRVARPFFLAGGLNPENAAGAVLAAGAIGADVSSGVELAPGRKDPDKVRRFIAAVRALPPL
jgi:phosphoribosylanthranilate isomerase